MIPRPLTRGHLCAECKGTGADLKRTAVRDRVSPDASYFMCRACNGNGLDPAEYFRWGKHKEATA